MRIAVCLIVAILLAVAFCCVLVLSGFGQEGDQKAERMSAGWDRGPDSEVMSAALLPVRDRARWFAKGGEYQVLANCPSLDQFGRESSRTIGLQMTLGVTWQRRMLTISPSWENYAWWTQVVVGSRIQVDFWEPTVEVTESKPVGFYLVPKRLPDLPR